MTTDHDDVLAEIRKVFPTAAWSIAMTDHEEGPDGEPLPSRPVLIVNAQLHGSKVVEDDDFLAAAHDLIVELVGG